jgi:ribosome-associated protein
VGARVDKTLIRFPVKLNLSSASFLTDDERMLIIERLAGRLDQEGNIHVVSQEDRSQLLNKEKTIAKLIALLKSAMHVQKKRKPTKTPKSVIRKRLADKQAVAHKKESRKRPQLD